MTSALIERAARDAGGTLAWSGNRSQLAAALARSVRNGDVVLTLGAGDIYKCADELLGLLRAGAPVPAVH